MRVDFLFPTPLLVHDVEPAVRDAIHGKVRAYLSSEKGKRDIAPAPEESVSTTYFKPQTSILADAGLKELEDIMMSAGRALLERTLELQPRRLEVERAWINVFAPGAQENTHAHDGNLLSCSYYVEAPAACGYLAFPDPIGERRSYREFTRTMGTNMLTRGEIALEPQPGRLVMFESWMPHYVQCNKSNDVRISIAVNLRYAT
jgi:uncharacterized protein (TIGR02466 family)